MDEKSLTDVARNVTGFWVTVYVVNRGFVGKSQRNPDVYSEAVTFATDETATVLIADDLSDERQFHFFLHELAHVHYKHWRRSDVPQFEAEAEAFARDFEKRLSRWESYESKLIELESIFEAKT